MISRRLFCYGFSVLRFVVSFGAVFLRFVQIRMRSIKLAEWLYFGIKLLSRLTMSVLCLFVVLVFCHYNLQYRIWF